MTAVIGILNKRGVAIAADSACTITKSNSRKIVTTANKMLRLCDNQQISVMIAGNAMYRTTPWDIIIRRFRQLHHTNQYDTVRDSAYMFFDYLKGEKAFATDGCHSGLHGPSPTTLVFSGFGEKEDLPALLAVDVTADCDSGIEIKEIISVTISDDTPAAICPFAQTDTMDAILYGINSKDENPRIENSLGNLLDFNKLFDKIKRKCDYAKYEDYSGINMLTNEYADRLNRSVSKALTQYKTSVFNGWLDAVKDYSLHDMASLAENLVSVTAFDRIMKFEEEGVGGLVDLAVISKVNGFTWLNRKSWYNHKDVGGQYGSLGV